MRKFWIINSLLIFITERFESYNLLLLIPTPLISRMPLPMSVLTLTRLIWLSTPFKYFFIDREKLIKCIINFFVEEITHWNDQ